MVSGLRDFVDSRAGKLYAQVCERWGTDPGAPLEEVDDVLAYNLRAALALIPAEAETSVDATGAVKTNLEEQMAAVLRTQV